MHQQENNDERAGWRSHWLVQNVFSELPLAGGFFHTSNLPHALHHSTKSTAMLLGGTAGSMFPILASDASDGMAEAAAKMTVNMALGMFLGVVAYNVLLSFVMMVYATCSQKMREPVAQDDEELQYLVSRA